MTDPTSSHLGISSIECWDKNAEYWDLHMQNGSEFQRHIIQPAMLELLGGEGGEKIIDIACGNGQMSRVLAEKGYRVSAVDGSLNMIRMAQKYSTTNIEYFCLDVLSEDFISFMQTNPFDLALCNMALMDITDEVMFFKNVARILKPQAPFILSQTHPCFEKAVGALFFEIEEENGITKTKAGVKVSNYLTPFLKEAKALPDMPAHIQFYHRPLHVIINAAFQNGFILEKMLEPHFNQSHTFTEHKGWHQIHNVPVAIAFRFRKFL